MQSWTEIAADEHAPLLGDCQPLLEQLGAAHRPVALDAMALHLRLQPLESPAALRGFLAAFRDDQLLPRELPAIRDAFVLAARGEARELIALDRQLGDHGALEPLLSASRRNGRDQLLRLRPLRDFRVTQRYLLAVESGEAQGWHTLAYGVTLAAYSIPLRQGLLHYARATLGGFAQSAARSLPIEAMTLAALVEEVSLPVAPAIDRLLGTGFGVGAGPS